MASKNSIKMIVGAGLALAVGSAFAAVSEDFEDGTFSGTWTVGGCELSAEKLTEGSHASITAGSPIGDGANAKVLAISGEAVCGNVDADAGVARSDFLVNVTEFSTDELEAPTREGVRIAVAAGASDTSTAPIAIYCKTNSTHAGWVTTDTTISQSTWHRLTLIFNYTNSTCQVSLDGVPVVNAAGYLKTDAATAGGSWYKFATPVESNDGAITSLNFIGLGSIDDVVVAAATSEDTIFPAEAKAKVDSKYDIALNDLTKWGVSTSTDLTEVTLAGTQSVAAKLEAGLDPAGTTDFAPTAMTLADGGTGALNATVSLPFEEAYGATRKYSVSFANAAGSTVSFDDGSGTTVDSISDLDLTDGKISFSIPAELASEPVLKIKVSVTATAAE